MTPEEIYNRLRREQERAKKALAKPLALGKDLVRKEAAQGAREAVMPWVLLSVALSLYAISKGKRRR